MVTENQDAQVLYPAMKSLNPSFLSMSTKNEDAQFFSLRDIVRRLFRRRWLILGIFLPVVIVVTAGSFLVFPSYEATAKILLRRERAALFLSPNELRPLISEEIREEDLNSEIELLSSRSLLEAVVHQHQLDAKPPCPSVQAHDSVLHQARVLLCQQHWSKLWRLPEALIARQSASSPTNPAQQRTEEALLAVANNLNIVPIKKSNLILVRYRDRDPVLAAQVVNSLIDHFQAKHVQLYQSGGAYELYRSETETRRDRLWRSEEALQEFEQEAEIADLAMQKGQSLIRLADFVAFLQAAEADIEGTREKIAVLENQLATQPKRVAAEMRIVQNEALSGIKAKLMELEVERSELQAIFKPGYSQLHEIEKKIQGAKRIIANEAATHIQEQSTQNNPIYQTLQSDLLQAKTTLASLEGRRRELQQQVRDYRQAGQRFSELEFEVERLKREVRMNEEAYLAYVKKEEEARFADAMDRHRIANISVAEPAYVPLQPVSPRKKLNVLLAIILGSSAGLAMASLAEYLDHTFQTREEVERHLGLPVLVSIPAAKQWERWELRRLGPGDSVRDTEDLPSVTQGRS
jgi:uncharacterized protein involved in exopolysaccharide biosynthesis